MSPTPRKIDSARAAELYLSGLSLKQVAEELGVSKGGLHLRLRADGVPMRPTGGGTAKKIPVDDEVLVQLREQGLTGSAIAKRLGMNRWTVYSRLRLRRLSGGDRRA